MTENISILFAFGAGLLSFLSPCILPLIPSYLCVIGGSPLGGVNTTNEFKPRLVARTASFILGFSAVFVVLSILLATTFILMGGVSRWINWISGAVVIILGLNIIFDFLAFLKYEKRLHLTNTPTGIVGAFLAGAAFGAGWTPCVGPILGGILLFAAQSGGIFQSAFYLAFYSAGLGIPFLLASVFFSSFIKASIKLRRHLPLVRRISGIMLVIIGVSIVTGHYQALNVLAAKWQKDFTGAKQSPKTSANDAGDIKGNTGNSGGTENILMTANGVSDEVISAFTRAGLPVANKGFDFIDFELPLLSGGSQRLSDLKGKVVLLNFWATWCGPCRIEMPSMEMLYQYLKDQDFTILAVNLAEEKQIVSAVIQQGKFTFPVLLDEKGSLGTIYGVQAIPTTYVIDRRGLIVSRMTGSINWNTLDMLKAMETLLNN